MARTKSVESYLPVTNHPRGKSLPMVVAISLALGFAFMAGCERPTDLAAPDESPEALQTAIPRADRIPPFIDEHYVDIALRVPGYGGHSLDDAGRMIIHLKDTTQAQLARLELANDVSLFAGARESTPEVEVREAAFDFLELTGWRSIEVPKAVGRVPGVWTVRTNPRTNKIEIGAESPAARAEARMAIIAMGVPEAALEFIDAQRPVPTFSAVAMNHDSTTSYAARMEAGRKIVRQRNNGRFYECTAGPIGKGRPNSPFAGSHWMIVADHCTNDLTGMWGIEFRQPNPNSGYIGVEAFVGRRYFKNDPDYFGSSFCNYHNGCRYTDAALVRLYASRPADHGAIAQPIVGGRAIVDVAPRFHVIDVVGLGLINPTPPQTNEVTMVGMSSGTQHGRVIDSSYSVVWPDGREGGGFIWLYNAGLGNWFSNRGDSGGPIFEIRNPAGWEVALRGITIGRIVSGSREYAVYSSMKMLKEDIYSAYDDVGSPIRHNIGNIEWRYGH